MVSGPGTLLNQCRLHKTKKHYSDCLTIKITLTPQASARCERKVFLLCDRSFKSSSSSALPQRRRRLGIVVQIVVFITYTETRCKWWRLGAPIRTLAPRTLTRPGCQQRTSYFHIQPPAIFSSHHISCKHAAVC